MSESASAKYTTVKHQARPAGDGHDPTSPLRSPSAATRNVSPTCSIPVLSSTSTNAAAARLSTSTRSEFSHAIGPSSAHGYCLQVLSQAQGELLEISIGFQERHALTLIDTMFRFRKLRRRPLHELRAFQSRMCLHTSLPANTGFRASPSRLWSERAGSWWWAGSCSVLWFVRSASSSPA